MHDSDQQTQQRILCSIVAVIFSQLRAAAMAEAEVAVPAVLPSPSDSTTSSSCPSPCRPAPPGDKTDEQRARRTTLRAAKLARKQREAAERRLLQRPSPAPTRPSDADPSDDCDGSGTARYGNFHTYYRFNDVDERLQFLTPTFYHAILNAHPHPSSTSSLPRLSGLPPCACAPRGLLHPPFAWLSAPPTSPLPVLILDLGCNEGNLTIALARRLHQQCAPRPVVAVAVDLDAALILRARAKSIDLPPSLALSFHAADITCPTTLSSLSSLPSSRYPLVTAFSLLMWLHLNHGSSVLSTVLSAIAAMADNVVIEWQPWRHYRTAIERRRRAGLDESVWQWAAIDDAWRGERGRTSMARVMEEAGMKERAVLGTTKWGREVIWFNR